MVEAIDHHPVEAGEAAHLARGHAIEGAQVRSVCCSRAIMARTSAPELTPCSSTQGSHSITTVSSTTCTATSKRRPAPARIDGEGARHGIGEDRGLQMAADQVDRIAGEHLVDRPADQLGAARRPSIRDVARGARDAQSVLSRRSGSRTAGPRPADGSARDRNWSDRRPGRCQSASAVSSATWRRPSPASGCPATNKANAARAPAMASAGACACGLRGFQMPQERLPQPVTLAVTQVARGGSNPRAAAREQIGDQQLGAEPGSFEHIERAEHAAVPASGGGGASATSVTPRSARTARKAAVRVRSVQSGRSEPTPAMSRACSSAKTAAADEQERAVAGFPAIEHGSKPGVDGGMKPRGRPAQKSAHRTGGICSP